MKKCLLTTLIVLSVAASYAGAQVTLPTWPQNFSFAAGEWASFGIPVTQAGTVTVDVTWTGCPVEITIRNGARKVVAQSGPKSPGKAQLTYNATAADVATGVLWSVSIKDARPASPTGVTVSTTPTDPNKPAPAAAAKGTVSVKCPEINAAAVQAQAASIKARLTAQSTAAQAELNKHIQARVRQQEQQAAQARQAKNATMATQLKSKLKGPLLPPVEAGAKRPAVGAAVASPGTPITGNAPGNVGPAANINAAEVAAAAAGPPGIPSISKLTPDVGYYLDSVTISAKSITPYMNSVQVWFVFNDTVEVQAKALSVTKTASGIDIVTEVPTTPAGTVVNRTKIHVMAMDQAPAYKTNSLSFSYQQTLTPQITSIDKPQVSPNTPLTIQGKNFKQGCKVHFVLSPGQDLTSIPSQVQSTSLQVWPPSYNLGQSQTGQIYVTTDVVPTASHPGPGTLQSNSVSASFMPTKPTITSLDKESAEPGESVLITGTGFYRPWVRWQADNGQSQKMFNSNTGTDWKVISYTETGIVAQIPDSVRGVMDTLNGQLSVQNHWGSHAQVPFKLKPLFITKPLLRAPLAYTSFRQHHGDDKYWVSTGGYNWIYAMHCSQIFTGHRGDEYYKLRFVLINGWAPDHVEVDCYPITNHKGARANGVGVDPSGGYPWASVHWWVDAPLDHTMYGITMWIRGPQGVPYRVPYNECEF